MATADQLLELIYSWIQQRGNCADELKELARELDFFREECILNSMLMGGASCPIGVRSLTLFSRGLLGATYTGRTVSIATQVSEHFSSSKRIEKAQEIEQQSNKLADKIQKSFERLKKEVEDVSSFADPDELDRRIMNEILVAVARRNGLKRVVIKLDMSEHHHSYYFNDDLTNMRLIRGLTAQEGMALLTGILSFFTFTCNGNQYKIMFAQGIQQLIKKMSTTGFKTALKGGAMVVGGAVGLAFSLPEAIDNWKDQIKNNHVTEASQSLRDTADAILKITRTLREQFDDIKTMLQEMEQMEETEEQNKHAKKEDEDNGKRKKIMIILKNSSQAKVDGSRQSNNKQCQCQCQCQGHCLCQKQKRTVKSEANKTPTINFTLQNIRSVNKRDNQTTLGDIIKLFKSDVVAISETHLKETTGDRVLRKNTPKGFDSFQQPRGTGQGGGVGMVSRQTLGGQRVHFPAEEEIASFESISARVQHDGWSLPILIITVYRPPEPRTLFQIQIFLKELRRLLSQAKKEYKSIIIAGDFNIWIDQKSTHTAEFRKFLRDEDLTSNVEEATHEDGHSLDLLLGYNVEISDVSVQDADVSDHYTVDAKVRPLNGESNDNRK